MRLVQLPELFEGLEDTATLTDETAAVKLRGSSPDGGAGAGHVGSRTVAAARISADDGGTANRHRYGCKRHPTLSELKRFAKAAGANTQGLAYAVLGRD